MKKLLLILLIPIIGFGQQTYVPDDNFEAYLEANGMGDGITLNDSVFTSAIDTVTFLNVGSKGIFDLTGIEDFSALTNLNCSYNKLTSLDVTQNIALTHLSTNGLNFDSYDLNPIQSLDLSNNINLEYLSCEDNSLSTLDISSNVNLLSLNCHNNQLTNLDVSQNINLTRLIVGESGFQSLYGNSNNISILDVSNNLQLDYLNCGGNQLTSLDLSQNTVLAYLDCSSNSLTSLDLRNNNNNNFTTFNCIFNPSLICINVDNTAWSSSNWTASNDPNNIPGNIDSHHNFSENCLTAFGCTDFLACNYDTIATIDNLTCVYPSSNTTTATSCDTYTWAIDGNTYTTSGTYTIVSTNASGCDHTETLNLNINYSSSSTDTQVACDTYTWVDGVTYITSNSTATHMFQTVDGCDSLSTLNLTINNSTSSIDTHVACDEFMWYCDGNTYTSSNNTAIYVYTNASGCDSTVTLDLTINNSTSNTTTAISCDTYTWAIDGNTYTASGTYTIVSTNASGCDHTETLELTINNSPNTTNILGVTNVEFLQIETYSVGQNINSIFTWYLNNGGIILNGINTNSVEVQWGSIDGSYDLFVVETTQNGCSDTAQILVNANCLSNASTSTISACDSYTWDGMAFTESGTYTNTYTNIAGCDSVHTLDLTIYSLIASIFQSGDNLSAVTTPVGLNANWYNIQTEDSTTRIWLMEEDASSFTPTFDCSYFIVVSDNGCTDTSEIYAYGENAARIGSFVTSPNPTTGLINVKFDNSKNQFVMFELVSNNGIKLDEFITIEDNLDIDLSKYPSGSYYLYFNSEDAVQGCRLEEVQKVSTKIILNK